MKEPAVHFAMPLLLAIYLWLLQDLLLLWFRNLFWHLSFYNSWFMYFSFAGVIGSFSLYSFNRSSFLPTSVPSALFFIFSFLFVCSSGHYLSYVLQKIQIHTIHFIQCVWLDKAFNIEYFNCHKKPR